MYNKELRALYLAYKSMTDTLILLTFKNAFLKHCKHKNQKFKIEFDQNHDFAPLIVMSVLF